MEIKVKANIKDSRMSDGLFNAMTVIHQINNLPEESINLDFSGVKFVTPLYVLPLVIYLHGCGRNITIVNENNYLQTILFSQGLQPDKMRRSEFLAIMEKYSLKTYIPIISFPATKERDDEKDAIISTVESIIARQLNLSTNIVTGIKYILGECVDNIIQHANSERGYIIAQSYPTKKYLDICIADNGITLLGSYKAAANNEIKTDIDAIQAANRGVSTKNLPNAENRGYGIITSKKMLIKGLSGTFVMMSGNSVYLYNDSFDTFIEMPQEIRWQGTIIGLRIPYNNKSFQYIHYVE